VAGSCVVTTFSHAWFLPIVPRESYVQSESEAGIQEVPIGMHFGSIFATYARTGASIWLVACLIAYATGSTQFVLGTSILVELGFLLAALVWAFFVMGRLSARTRAQRRVHAKFAGAPVDVARFSRAQAHDLREQLEQVLVAEGRGQSLAYRADADPRRLWREIAMRPDVHDAAFLEAALTRSRLELRWAESRAERRTLVEAHELIWRKLEPSVRPRPHGPLVEDPEGGARDGADRPR
jgi:hypothetical protein